ncbi:MAG: hypothetical protein LBL13_13530 [Bacteroidales bacterium]|jgi:hypothetical protein|nr:hypothetical protein [Bacteroidales bacterium]
MKNKIVSYFKRRFYKRLFLKAYIEYVKRYNDASSPLAYAHDEVSEIAVMFKDEAYFPLNTNNRESSK